MENRKCGLLKSVARKRREIENNEKIKSMPEARKYLEMCVEKPVSGGRRTMTFNEVWKDRFEAKCANAEMTVVDVSGKTSVIPSGCCAFDACDREHLVHTLKRVKKNFTGYMLYGRRKMTKGESDTLAAIALDPVIKGKDLIAFLLYALIQEDLRNDCEGDMDDEFMYDLNDYVTQNGTGINWHYRSKTLIPYFRRMRNWEDTKHMSYDEYLDELEKRIQGLIEDLVIIRISKAT